MATANQNHLNIYNYFKYLFERLPNRKDEELETYLPWSKKYNQNAINNRVMNYHFR
ncbi:transposase domain-containing protein [Limosilactobacillus reuteri]|nr:transposase domain-containing protein [Limosilactobacillus reuteri]MCC4412618.1 transposase domain-containing protein [Limosilactobacillus reuteri]